MYENRKFVIFDTSETGSIQFYKPATYDESGSLLTEAIASEVMETTGSTLRLNVSGSKTFVKYEGSQPSSITALSSKSEEYSYSEILNELARSEWKKSHV